MKRTSALFLALVLVLTMATAEERFSRDYAAMNEAAASALIITTYDAEGKESGVCSGFIAYDSRHAVTHCDALVGAASLAVCDDLGNDLGTVRVLGADSDIGLAILSFDEDTHLPALPLNDGGEVMRGSGCVAIGAEEGFNAVNAGNISSFFDNEGISYVQFTAPISQNAKGGALLDDEGRVAGMILTSYESPYVVAQNLNFALNIRHVNELWAYCKDDEPVELASWGITDIAPGSTYAAPSRSFTLINATGALLSEVYVSPRSGSKARIGFNWVKQDQELTVDFDAYEDITPDSTIVIDVYRSGESVMYTAIMPTLGEMMGNTYKMAALRQDSYPKVLSCELVSEGEEQEGQRHVRQERDTSRAAFALPQKLDRDLPEGKCCIVNETNQVILGAYMTVQVPGSLMQWVNRISEPLLPGEYVVIDCPKEIMEAEPSYECILEVQGRGEYRARFRSSPDDFRSKVLYVVMGENGRCVIESGVNEQEDRG